MNFDIIYVFCCVIIYKEWKLTHLDHCHCSVVCCRYGVPHTWLCISD